MRASIRRRPRRESRRSYSRVAARRVRTDSRLRAVSRALGKTSRLDPLTREVIALAVSATNGCAYCVNSHTAALRKLGLDHSGLAEVMAVVALFNTTNALADGYQVAPDVFPPLD